MSLFKLEINLDNAAYNCSEGLDPHYELLRNLEAVAEVVARDCWEGKIRDSNGNIVGNWSIEE